MPRWSDNLARDIRDRVDNVTLRTRDNVRHYMAALPETRARTAQWQSAARLLLEGASAEAVTKAIELALMYEARLDVKMANERSRNEAPPTEAAYRLLLAAFRDGRANAIDVDEMFQEATRAAVDDVNQAVRDEKTERTLGLGWIYGPTSSGIASFVWQFVSYGLYYGAAITVGQAFRF